MNAAHWTNFKQPKFISYLSCYPEEYLALAEFLLKIHHPLTSLTAPLTAYFQGEWRWRGMSQREWKWNKGRRMQRNRWTPATFAPAVLSQVNIAWDSTQWLMSGRVRVLVKLAGLLYTFIAFIFNLSQPLTYSREGQLCLETGAYGGPKARLCRSFGCRMLGSHLVFLGAMRSPPSWMWCLLTDSAMLYKSSGYRIFQSSKKNNNKY